ncbi:hypothetical protein F0562_012038 [Nyssa sinensis]|uniref:Uncharacterized protein n=1 Tax=Nyssa sinensis TaxID=561372 RepID=A0A5J4ZSI3_9ASTE|nr:hypothetical protein F0562_012038 [Nyssa sinensis]
MRDFRILHQFLSHCFDLVSPILLLVFEHEASLSICFSQVQYGTPSVSCYGGLVFIAISLVPRSRNPSLFRSAIAQTRYPSFRVMSFGLSGILARAFVSWISFDLTLTLIEETFGIPREDYPGFPYALRAAPQEEVLAKAIHRDRSVAADEDMEADVAKGVGTVPDQEYLVDQTPSQYRQDPSSPCLFYPDPGPVCCQSNDEDDGDDDNGDDGDFTTNTSTA